MSADAFGAYKSSSLGILRRSVQGFVFAMFAAVMFQPFPFGYDNRVVASISLFFLFFLIMFAIVMKKLKGWKNAK